MINTFKKKMKKTFLLIFLFYSSNFLFAQFFGQIPQTTKYDAKKVVDPDYGITIYEKLNFAIGGDSVRNDKKGYACQGWIEDFYISGPLIHKGYYEDGQLKIYKNFYENGNVERVFKMVGLKSSNMQLFYSDGKLKSDVTYYKGDPQVWTDFYSNGQIEYTEENSKSMEYLIFRKSYSSDGKPQEIFELIDAKKKRYSKKEYFENGKIKAEGEMRYNASVIDYQRDGTWKVYDESGKMTTEKWINGEENH
jgi:antitoxin component YwqK of YwqJK toxin-antitoxin module